jgi:zinc/manganese transport system substrate-binding protein
MALGTVIPGASTLAEPSANDLAELIAKMEEYGLCTIFTETAVSDTLAQTVAGELVHCDEVKVLPLYTGSLGTVDSGANSYSGMFRANVDTIIVGLK